MFHIFFSADNNYVKYTSVLINSIIESTDINKKSSYFNKDFKDGYHFHIMSDYIDEDNLIKLSNLENELNKKYKCLISVNILDDSDFVGFPKWRGNYLAYYRIKISKFIEDDVKFCLYLDSDMIAMSDIREILSLDITNYTVAAVLDGNNNRKRKFKYLSHNSYYTFDKNEQYFNSGFLFINLKKWKEQKIEKKCFDFLNTYKPIYPDQDALNYAIDSVYKLPIKWNFMISYIIGDKIGAKNIFKTAFKKTSLQYTKEEFYNYKDNAKIIHFSLDEKPWHKESFFYFDNNFNPIKYPYFDEFWNVAKNVPYFNEDLLLTEAHMNTVQTKDLTKILPLILKTKRYIVREDYRKLRLSIIILYIVIFLSILFLGYYYE